MRFFSTKTYGSNLGLTTCFRQHRAKSHCRFLHGYSLEIKLIFGADELDENGWVADFGGLRHIKQWLEAMFDHKTLVAMDDPDLETFEILDKQGLIQAMYVPATGCEAFAKQIYEYITQWLPSQKWAMISDEQGGHQRVKLISVEVREHGANSAIYSPSPGGKLTLTMPRAEEKEPDELES